MTTPDVPPVTLTEGEANGVRTLCNRGTSESVITAVERIVAARVAAERGPSRPRCSLAQGGAMTESRTADERPDVLLVHRSFKHVDGRNVPADAPEHVRILIDPNLAKAGETRFEPYGGYTIALREWDGQVLLHELLHVLLEQYLAFDGDGGFNHRIINTIEVGLWPHLALLAQPAAADERGEG